MRKFIPFLLVLIPATAYPQSWSQLQQTFGGNGGTFTCTVGSASCTFPTTQPTTAGSVMGIYIITNNAATISSVTGGGGTWVKCPAVTNSQGFLGCNVRSGTNDNLDAIYNVSGTGGVSSFTVTLNTVSVGFFYIGFIEFKPPIAGTAVLDTFGVNASLSCSTTCPGAALTLTSSDAVVQFDDTQFALASCSPATYQNCAGAGIINAVNITTGTGLTITQTSGGTPTAGFFSITALAFKSSTGTTRTAATCNSADVQAQVNLSANGDTVVIPAGSCTWSTTGVTVPTGIGITIIGTGTPQSGPTQFGASATCQQTIITDALTGGRTLISMTPTAAVTAAATSRISCMRINPTVPSTGYNNPLMIVGTCTTSTCPNLRLDNLYFPTTWVQNPILVSDNTMVVKSNVFGVGDHNTVGDALASSGQGIDFINENNGNYLAVGTWGDNTWAQPDVAGGFQSFYLENNQLLNSFLTDTDTSGQAFGGGRFVCRFNQVTSINTTSGVCANHGTDTNGRNRGGRIFEAYYNTGTCTVDGFGTTGCGSTWPGRSSTGIIFGNTFTNGTGGNLKSMANIDNQRRWRVNSTWGLCDGSSPWDSNDTNGNPGNTAFVYYTGTIQSFVLTGPGSQEMLVTVNGSPGWTTNQWATIGAPWSMHDSTHTGGAEVNSNTANSLTLNLPDSTHGLVGIANGDTITIMRAFSCMDQAGRGQGLLVTGPVNGSSPVLQSTGAPGNVTEVLDPVYEGGDSIPAGAANTIASDTNSLIANRDFYRESVNQAAQTSATLPFNGTSGTGHGTCGTPCGGTGSQFRPTTCTTGVGYFATDVGAWDTSGGGHKGVLYVCTSTNTWTLYWTPGTYPHPLISGTLVPSVSFSPTSLSFGSLPVGTTSASQTITITSTGTANLSFGPTGTTSPAGASFNPVSGGTCPISGTLTPGSNCTVNIQVTANTVGGPYSGTFNFPSNAGLQTVPLTATVTGGTPAVTLNPTALVFGNVIVNQQFVQNVLLTNSGTAALSITSIAQTGTGYTQTNNCPASVGAGTACTIQVKFSPIVQGTSAGTLTIVDNAAGSPHVVGATGNGILVPVVATGVVLQCTVQ